MDDIRAEKFALALSHHRAGRHSEAASTCRALLAADRADAAALYLYGLVRFAMGAIEDAIGLMRKLVALLPANALGQAALARLLALAGRPAEALAAYRAAAALSPEDAELAAGLANAERAAGDPEAAIATCRQALRRSPDNAALHESLARALLAAGQNDAAIAALAPLLEQPSLPEAARAEAFFLRAAAYKSLQEFAPAIEDFCRAIEAAPRHAAAHLDLGNALAAIERADEARRHLECAIAIDPALKEAHASLGSILLLAGEERAAEQAFGRALALDPDMALAHQNLAAICEATGRTTEASAHRDAAYRRQTIFVEPAGREQLRVLLLTSAHGGNVPTKYLFPRRHCTLIKWITAYAPLGQETALPPFDLVFNGIGDPDAAPPAPLAHLRARRLLNPPAQIHRTRRDLLPDLLAGIETIVVPSVRRGAGALPSGLHLPVLLRRAGSHGGQGVRLITSEEALAVAWPASDETLYLTAFHPFRSADGQHRKYRMIFVDRRPFPYHLAIASHWLVHHATAGMEADPAKCAEERRFLEDPEGAIGGTAMDGVRRIGERLDLDFAGVDFSVLPDGRALVFEANATMLVHPEDETGPLAYRNQAIERILDAFGALTRGSAPGPRSGALPPRPRAKAEPLQSIT